MKGTDKQGMDDWTEEIQILFGKQAFNLEESGGILAILLHEGLLQVRSEEYPHVAVPEENTKESEIFNKCYEKMPNLTDAYIRWCGWNWLRNKGEMNPIINNSSATLNSPTLNMFVQVGKGSPFRIIEKILAEGTNVFVFMPSHFLHKLYIFEPTDVLQNWLAQDQNNTHGNDQSENQHLLSNLIYHIGETVKYRKKLEDYYKKQAGPPIEEATPGQLLNKSGKELKVEGVHVDETTENEDLNLFEVGQFIKHDPIYGTGISPRIGQLKKFIQQGELKAHQEKNIWKVKKKDLIEYLQKQKLETDSFNLTEKVIPVEKEETKTTLVVKREEPQDWTDEKDQKLIKFVLDGVKQGKKLEEIFDVGIPMIGMSKLQCENRWYYMWADQYRDEISQRKAKMDPKSKNKVEIVDTKPNSYPLPKNKTYYTEKEKDEILFQAIIDGTREGLLIKEITESVSKIVGIPANTLHGYWNRRAPKQLKEEFKQIKLDQEKNWSEEDSQILEYMINLEYADLPAYHVLPFASKRLKKHIDIVRKKFFELQREKRIRR